MAQDYIRLALWERGPLTDEQISMLHALDAEIRRIRAELTAIR
jgi:hypothetical protein